MAEAAASRETGGGRGPDWVGGAKQSQLHVLRTMVSKLSAELGREQARHKDTGLQLDQVSQMMMYRPISRGRLLRIYKDFTQKGFKILVDKF